MLTTFVAQTSQTLSPDNTAISNSILLELVALLRAQANGTSFDSIPPADTLFTAARTDIWVNGLWFAALSCSLSAALVSMLSKQWIQPIPNVSGSPRYRARQRQRRHIQLKQWRVSAVINALPLLLHIALVLFFAGIIVLLWSGEVAIMAATFAIVALAYTFYLGSMWMSLIYPDCPYQHPISEHLRLWVSEKAAPRSPSDLEVGDDVQIQSKYAQLEPVQGTNMD